jgi:ATP-dependent Clp protease ATP-binding subunit ClpC
MPTHRFHVLVWEDYSGYFTARLVDDMEAPAAFGPTAAEAVYQLKEVLDWSFQKFPWRSGPDFSDPKLIQLRLEVRPEYHLGERIYPCDEKVVLRVPCVHGRNSAGLHLCSLPTLGVTFLYNEPHKLKDLATHYAQESLRGKTPAGLSRYLQPREVELMEIVLHTNIREANYSITPSIEILETIAEPLGDKSLRRRFSRAWERERETADLVRRISRERANVIIAGEAGAGKTSVLIEAVRQIEQQSEQESESDDDKPRIRFRYWLTSGARLIAGMQYLGEWQARCERVIEEISEINGVLCLDNLLDLVRTGTGSVAESLAMFFMPYLQRGEMRMIAEVTPAELDACRRLLPGLVDLFQTLKLEPFGRQEAITVLGRVAANHARNHRIEFAEGVTATVYRLFNRFLPYQAFPGKSVAFINDLVERAVRSHSSSITASDVIAQFIRQTGLPEMFLRDEIPLDYDAVLEAFRQQVIGQESACETAAHLVTTFKAGLNDPNRPLGVLLFCGPTGVGKTELARVIARYFFGHGEQDNQPGRSDDRLVRLDLSEYAHLDAARALVLAPDGEPSEFIKKVRQQPFCVVLLDEIEKADAAVFDVLLGVFDEGRLTDRYGRVTSFRSAVIIMTSNLGADKLENIGFESKGSPSYSREAMNFFRPEFFNRIDAIVQFNSLTKEMMRQITAKELGEIAAREGLQRNNLRLVWSEELIEHLIKSGFDQRYGARPLQRTIETMVVAPLAKHLLANPHLKNTTMRISIGEGGMLIATAQIEQLPAPEERNVYR